MEEVAQMPERSSRPEVVVFDVNETLSDLAPLGLRFAEVGATASLAKIWFAELLRDGFALTVAGSRERFAVLGREGLAALLADVDLDRDLDAAVDHVMAGFQSLDVHPDVIAGVRALAAGGLRLVTLSNGATSVADGLLSRAGLRDEFEQLFSAEETSSWKPTPAPYEYAARRCGVDIGATMLVAVHPWDVDGAARAGAQTAWVDRDGARYPSYFSAPGRTVTGIDDLAAQLT
ncbi:MAG: haloacid dehalogenase type II [Nocardioidaceae bacterium]